ncbi:MAG: UPF0146 family protein [Euryarchaeota archaeon]|jgi:uncharacterized UPF0146 family protein|uniref:UPF0146 family protein n=1 Tax=Methanobacterium sp. MZD130B TaxID=3394378 RepID=UPI00176E8411|nr:UPF0146 family protein [Euryarchaeota archaeon]HHT18105.1 hypothetical protein [Methanobacterium sp.]
MWNDFIEYLTKHYSNSPLIVEVGVGNFLKVALYLKNHLKVNIVMTDIKPSHDQIILDDIRQPDLKIYKDAGLIYALRPPEELHPYLVNLSDSVGADLIIKPLSTDFINTRKKMELVNYKKAVFYKHSFK